MTLHSTAGIGASGMPSLDASDIAVYKVPWRIGTEATLRGLAHIVRDFAAEEVEIVPWPVAGRRPLDRGTGVGGGVTEGHFEFYWEGELFYAHNHAVDGHYTIGWFADPAKASPSAECVDRSRVYVCEANYHPDGGQVFFPRHGTPYIALLAPPGDDVRPEDFCAFYCDGSFGIQLRPDVWHQPLYPLENHAVFEDKQGRVHACVSVDFVKEFGVYLEVPLRRS